MQHLQLRLVGHRRGLESPPLFLLGHHVELDAEIQGAPHYHYHEGAGGALEVRPEFHLTGDFFLYFHGKQAAKNEHAAGHPCAATEKRAKQHRKHPPDDILFPHGVVQGAQDQGNQQAQGGDYRQVNGVEFRRLAPDQHPQVEGNRPAAPASQLQGPEEIALVL